MKKVRLFLLLLMAAMMPLAMQAQQALPYSYGFENNNLATDGWTMSNCHSSTGINTAAKMNGTYGFRFYYTSNYPQYLISPELTGVTSGLMVEFYYKNSSSSFAETFMVGYSTTDNAPASFTWGEEITASNTQWTLYSNNSFPAGTKYIAIKHTSDDQFYLYLDDFTFMVPPTCPNPTGLTCTGKTATTASLSWNAGGSETTWTLEYGTAADFTGATSVNVTENPTKEITGLTPQTQYYARVKAVCTAGTDESDWCNSVSFTTECEGLTISETNVYEEGFEEYTGSTYGDANGVIPDCWASYSTGSVKPHVIGSGSYYYHNEGTKALTFYGNGNCYAALPFLTNAINSLQIDFFMQTESATNGTLTLGYILANDVNYNTFTAIETFANHTDSMEAHNVALNNVPDAAARLVFRWFYSYNYSCCIDDITVSLLPSCLKPADITADNVTPNSATITWADYNTPAPLLGWTVRMGEMDTTVSTNSFTLNNLTPGTSYTVQVKANCADDDESEWATGTFRTLYGIPFVEPFNTNSLPDDWTLYSGLLSNVMGGTATLSSATSPKWNFGTANGLFDSHARLNIYGTSCKGWLVTPTIVMDEDVKLAFDLALCKYSLQAVADPVVDTAQQDDKFVVLVTTDTGTTWTILRQYDNAGSEFVYNSIATEGEMVVIDMAAYAGQNIALAFYGESTVANNGDNNLHIDNVQLVTCIAPSNLTVDSNITTTSATIGWTDFGTPASWTIKVNDVEIPATTNPFTLTDLTPATLYTVQVKANCTADDESAWSSEIYFVTECPETFVVREANPFHEGFEGGSVSCWSTEQAEGAGSWGIGNTTGNAYEGTNYAIAPFTPGNVTRLVSPVIDLSQVENPVLSYAHFQAFYQDTLLDVLTVYYRTSETSDWVLIADYADSSYTTYVEETHELPEPSATYQISFLASSHDGYNILVDDINITGIDIPEPCAVPANVTVSEENVVTWEGTAASYNVMVIVGEDTTTTTNVTTNTYTIEGLEDGTQGTVAVQAVCAEDDLSDWSEAVAFTIVEGINDHAISANIFPNPTTGNVTVESNAIGADITVFDMFGKLMMTSKVASGRTELNFSGIAPGVYMVRIANDNAVTTVKVVKE